MIKDWVQLWLGRHVFLLKRGIGSWITTRGTVIYIDHEKCEERDEKFEFVGMSVVGHLSHGRRGWYHGRGARVEISDSPRVDNSGKVAFELCPRWKVLSRIVHVK